MVEENDNITMIFSTVGENVGREGGREGERERERERGCGERGREGGRERERERAWEREKEREREREWCCLAMENVVLCGNGGSFIVMDMGCQQNGDFDGDTRCKW